MIDKEPIRIVYYGHYRDGTGWGNAALGYINSLLAANKQAGNHNEIICVPCQLNKANVTPPQHILEIEKKRLSGTAKKTVVIQHTLPHLMNRIEQAQYHVGLAVFETDSFTYTNWPEKLNLMDQVWVPCHDNIKACHASSVYWGKLHLVPHAYDETELDRYENITRRRLGGEFDGNYIFYTISEFTRRKNFEALLRAYFTEFDPSEPVSVLIKTSGGEQRIAEFISRTANSLKLYNSDAYQRVATITSKLNDNGMLQLHKNCDCYVNTSRGEAWSLPTFQAYALGKQVLSADVGGCQDFLPTESLVPTTPDFCHGATDTLPEIYTGRESWREVDVFALRYKMRRAYQSRSYFKYRPDLSRYSYEYIGNMMVSNLRRIGGGLSRSQDSAKSLGDKAD